MREKRVLAAVMAAITTGMAGCTGTTGPDGGLEGKGMAGAAAPAGGTAAPAQPSAPGLKKPGLTVEGWFETKEKAEIRYSPDAYKGDLRIRKIVEPGAVVKKGDLLIQFDTEAIDDQIRQAKADRDHNEKVVQRAQQELEAQAISSRNALARVNLDLEVAQAKMKRFSEINKPEKLRGAEHSVRRAQERLENAQVELDQLRKMYQEDQLVDATEEIVLKRAERGVEWAQRDLETAQTNKRELGEFDLPVEERQITLDLEQKRQEQKRVGLSSSSAEMQKKMELDRALQAREKQDDLVKKLESDRERMTVKAPAAGTVHHGVAGRAGLFHFNRDITRSLFAGGKVPADQTLLTIQTGGGFQVFAAVQEGIVSKLKGGAGVTVRSPSVPDLRLVGKVARVGSVPSPRSWFDQGNAVLFDVLIEFEGTDPRIQAGGKATIEVEGTDPS